ncbi:MULTISPECIES: phosphatase PAP2 family protein [Streptomyces]|uniref:Inositolphosphotransferase Aur1/Ipt1 domain-containing protein n=1 Tax=Streptomyces venezuelae TaxID=54571 RepID=A0A5P2BA65_STRVZ|nr:MULTISPECIES: phosphatase PAP2 family protein [Streptomyces]MYY84160.1 PAP2 family protein [Streptomyces sp. SID335]NEA04150.1 phosphatase PAP2 family protein [Streptomyces sp. SID10116]MYZ13570.1 PAP2 family protein [Streptomyces sp. SID337]NDZ90518.1 phosphatase PAP2 family protein [Streptomyces sp. SID10115]NEB48307.1 phosphatase PAP2 family protein [Streptomyces sp. SID339]
MPKTDVPGTAGITGHRLRWWTELPLIVLVYAAYSAGRLIVRGDVASAIDHGVGILKTEQFLRLNAESPLNRLFTANAWIGVPADFWYASLHYLVTPAVLVWLFRSRAVHYRAARAWLMISTMIGLVGFTLLPTCPPRLLSEGYGFVDTMAQYSDFGWWGGEASAPRGLGGMTNQYAAMPSLHVGWALWCGVMLWRCGRSPLTRAAAVGYPLITTIVVMGTANHYFFDALAGAAVMGVGFLLVRPVQRLTEPVMDRLRARFLRSPEVSSATESSIVGAGCQTSAGERIPRQRKQSAPQGAESSARPAEAGRPADVSGDGAPAPAH